ncbi:MAG: hypothetical protein ACI9JN_002577 [Bacteroidia bacterium]|jgi:hypothetical protein
MKTKQTLLILFLLCINYIGYSQDWRYTDLKIQFVSPEPNTPILSPGIINFKFKIVNQGPDTIYPTDTIFYKVGHSYSGHTKETRREIGRILVPHDSMTMADTISINSRAFKSSFELSFSQVPMIFGPDKGKLRLINEFSEDRDDNFSKVNLFHSGNLGVIDEDWQMFSIFPNPVKDNFFFVKTTSDIQSLKLFNSKYQQISTISYTVNDSRAKVTLQDLPKGFYYLEIQQLTGLLIKPIIIN